MVELLAAATRHVNEPSHHPVGLRSLTASVLWRGHMLLGVD